MSRKIVNGLDIGTSKVVFVVAEKKKDSPLRVLGVGESVCNGLRRGAVVDLKETIESIKKAKEKAEKNSGLTIKEAWVGLEGDYLKTKNSQGTVAVSKADGEVSQDDVRRVIEAARAISIPRNNEIIDVVPRGYTIDNQSRIGDPVGMSGVRLELDALVLHGPSFKIKNLKKSVKEAGLDIKGLIATPLSLGQILNKRQKDLGVVLLDLGAGTTSLIVFEENENLLLKVLPVAGHHVANDIAIGLRTSIEVAERLKKDFGVATVKTADRNKKIDLSKIDPEEERVISQLELARIIEPRLKEIFSMVNEQLEVINRRRLLPGGAILSGGTSQMKGIVDLAKKELELPARKLTLPPTESMVDNFEEATCATALSLIFWSLDQEKVKEGFPLPDILSGVWSKIKKIFRMILP